MKDDQWRKRNEGGQWKTINAKRRSVLDDDGIFWTTKEKREEVVRTLGNLK